MNSFVDRNIIAAQKQGPERTHDSYREGHFSSKDHSFPAFDVEETNLMNQVCPVAHPRTEEIGSGGLDV